MNNNELKEFPKTYFQIGGYSDDPEIKKKEIEELKEKSRQLREEYLQAKKESNVTIYEFQTSVKLNNYILNCMSNNVKLDLKNNNKTKYYSVEDGNIFKYISESGSFYRLNLNDFVWEYDNSLFNFYNDPNSKYTEISDFKDYYPNREDLDLDKGRHI